MPVKSLKGLLVEKPPRLTKENVLNIAWSAGLKLEDLRAESIAARLCGVLDELDAVSDDTLLDIEPTPTFIACVEELDG